MKLKDFIQQTKYANPDQLNVAGYEKNGKFHYFESTSKVLPAAAYIVTKLGDKDRRTKIITNLKKGHWIMTYLNNIKHSDYLKNVDKNVLELANTEITPDKLTNLTLPSCPQGPSLNAPLTDGGLYTAASSLKVDYEPSSEEKGLARVLRYYMLATYSILPICAEEGYKGLNNYIAAMMVNDQGRILSTGVNTGSFRHAEVMMLLSYFKNNTTKKSFDENTIIFSTLTPCKQCTGYLTDARPGKSVIYFGQVDTGDYGSAGESISSKFSSKTKPPKARVVATGASGINKAAVATGLSGCMGAGMIAKQIGNSDEAKKYLSGAANSLIHKVGKSRTDSDEDVVKDKVLRYLADWIIGFKTV